MTPIAETGAQVGLRAVFLDRDGVLNRAIVRDGKPYPPAGLRDLEILEDAVRGCARLRAAGFLLVGATNQPDLARGKAQRAEVDAINDAVAAACGLDAMRVCPHDNADACACRKPKPGLLLDAARMLNIDLAGSFMVGDRWRDVAAGAAAGCRTIFMDRRYDERRPEAPDFIADGFDAAADWILAQAVAGPPAEAGLAQAVQAAGSHSS
jgi:D-glycero-D-manno-heptose 1,7-bisphosphate phosphatase